MSATCGDYGGTKEDGAPCGRPAGWGTDAEEGRCRDHPHPSPFRRIKHRKKRAFLTALVETAGNITRACELVGIAQCTPYSKPWLEDEEFQGALKRAKTLAADALEAEAVRRAHDGVREPVGFYRGAPSEYVQKYSDTLLIFLLKGLKPQKYADRIEHAGEIDTGADVHVYLPDNRRDGDRGDGGIPDAVRERQEALSDNGAGPGEGEEG